MYLILIRFIIFGLIIYLLYRAFKYIISPKRKLELAYEKKTFYLYDHKENVKKNLLLTYKGVLFEGEKYLGTTENTFEVISIFLWAKSTEKLQGLGIDDFLFIEKKLLEQYPKAKIDWKSPIKEFLHDRYSF